VFVLSFVQQQAPGAPPAISNLYSFFSLADENSLRFTVTVLRCPLFPLPLPARVSRKSTVPGENIENPKFESPTI
jgi:hypothetical protein